MMAVSTQAPSELYVLLRHASFCSAILSSSAHWPVYRRGRLPCLGWPSKSSRSSQSIPSRGLSCSWRSTEAEAVISPLDHRAYGRALDCRRVINGTPGAWLGMTACMPCSFRLLLHPRSRTGAQRYGPLRVTVVVRRAAAVGGRCLWHVGGKPARTTIVPTWR